MKKFLVGLLALGVVGAGALPAQAEPTDRSSGVYCLYNNTTNPYDQAAGNACYSFDYTGVRLILFRDSTCSNAPIESPAERYGPIAALHKTSTPY